MRACLLSLLLIAGAPAFAQTHDHSHDDHVAEAEGLRVIHVWTPATAKGADALFYMEIENSSAAEAMLTGGEAGGQELELVGFSYGAAGEAWTVPAMVFGLAGLGNAASLVDLQGGVAYGFVDLLFVRGQLSIELAELGAESLQLALDAVEGLTGQGMGAVEQALPGGPSAMSTP